MSLSAQLLEDANDLGGVGGRVGDRRPGRGAGDADKPILVHVSSTRPSWFARGTGDNDEPSMPFEPWH